MTPRTGTYAKGLAKRAEILAVGLEVVAENGCRRATVREIAARVGLTAAGVVHYFESREELFQEILAARDDRDREIFEDKQPRPIDGYLRLLEHNPRVRGLVQLYAEYSAEAAGWAEHPSRVFFQERFDQLRADLTAVVQAAQADGSIGRDFDVPAVVNLLIAAADGLQVQWMLDHRIDMSAHVDQLWRLLAPRTASE